MIAKGKILIADDDAATRRSLGHWLEGEGYTCGTFETGAGALAAVDAERWDAALVDIRMPDLDGVELLARIRAIDPEVPVIMITAYASVETAVRTLRSGALDYFEKPIPLDRLARTLEGVLERSRSRREVERLRHNLREVSPATELIGESTAMKRVREQVETGAPTDAPILVTGERGTGKEIVARALHAGSRRSPMPLVVVRCGSLTEELLEGELFGFEREPSDSAPRKKGKFEIADGGTVFLDEIGDVSLRTQNDLLNILETGEMIRVGGSKPVRTDFRWIAASNRDLRVPLREGTFRAQLFYRLNVFSIDLPRLCDRREDIPLLVDYFLRKHAAAMNRPVPPISGQAIDLLLRYRWPGNVRELENSVERAILISQNEEIRPEHFPFQVDSKGTENGRSLEEMERNHIQHVVEDSNWNLSRSARILGIDRTTLYNKIKKYGLR